MLSVTAVRPGSAMQHAIAVPVVERLICSKLLVVQTSDVYRSERSQQCAHDDKSPT
jgi:hypothetical protein